VNSNSADYNRDVTRRCTNAVFKSRRRRHFGPARGTHALTRYYYYYYYYYHHRRRIPHQQPPARSSAFPATPYLSRPELDHRVGRGTTTLLSYIGWLRRQRNISWKFARTNDQNISQIARTYRANFISL
jgi:hypothetical protein